MMPVNSIIKIVGATIASIFVLNQIKNNSVLAREIISGFRVGAATVEDKNPLPKFNDFPNFNNISTSIEA